MKFYHGFWRFCLLNLQNVLPQDLPHFFVGISLKFRWDFWLVCHLFEICSSKRNNFGNYVMKLDNPLQPVPRCFQLLISTTFFGGKMLWHFFFATSKISIKCCLFPFFRAARRFARTFCHQKNRWNFIGISSKMNLADWWIFSGDTQTCPNSRRILNESFSETFSGNVWQNGLPQEWPQGSHHHCHNLILTFTSPLQIMEAHITTYITS